MAKGEAGLRGALGFKFTMAVATVGICMSFVLLYFDIPKPQQTQTNYWLFNNLITFEKIYFAPAYEVLRKEMGNVHQ